MWFQFLFVTIFVYVLVCWSCFHFSGFTSFPLCLNNNTIQKSPKCPSWSQAQLKEAINCILTQQLRFTQASARFRIPKGTLYDNILGKTRRCRMLEEIGLSPQQEMSVLEFACDVALMPYNRRTSRPLIAIVDYVKSLKGMSDFPVRKAFKWWWAFCKKHSIISLYYRSEASQNLNFPVFVKEERQCQQFVQPQPPLQTSPQNLTVSKNQGKSWFYMCRFIVYVNCCMIWFVWVLIFWTCLLFVPTCFSFV